MHSEPSARQLARTLGIGNALDAEDFAEGPDIGGRRSASIGKQLAKIRPKFLSKASVLARSERLEDSVKTAEERSEIVTRIGILVGSVRIAPFCVPG